MATEVVLWPPYTRHGTQHMTVFSSLLLCLSHTCRRILLLNYNPILNLWAAHWFNRLNKQSSSGWPEPRLFHLLSTQMRSLGLGRGLCPLWCFKSYLYGLRWMVGPEGEVHMRAWLSLLTLCSWFYFLLRVRCSWHEFHVSANSTVMSGYQQTMQNTPTDHLDRSQENVWPLSWPGTDLAKSRACARGSHPDLQDSRAHQILGTTWVLKNGLYCFCCQRGAQEKPGLVGSFVLFTNQFLDQLWPFLGFTKVALLVSEPHLPQELIAIIKVEDVDASLKYSCFFTSWTHSKTIFPGPTVCVCSHLQGLTHGLWPEVMYAMYNIEGFIDGQDSPPFIMISLCPSAMAAG